MNYQELVSLVGGSNPKSATYQDIVSGIQSQLRPQTQFAPTRSLLDSMVALVPDQPRIAYGSLLQAQPRKLPEPFDITKYTTKTEGDTDTGLTGGDSGGSSVSVGGNTSTTGSSGFTIGPDGLATPNTVNQAAAIALGMITGFPVGLVTSQINATNTAAANAHNAAMTAEANDAIGSIAASSPTATAGATGTGTAAAAAGTAAATAATANGNSPTAAAAAGQAAADATVNGASPAAAAAAGEAAAAAADGGGVSGISADGIGFADGGMVTMNRLMGSNPMGQDDGYASLQSGEYVIKKDAVDKYGEDFLGLLNSGKLTKKQIKSLL